MPDKGGRESEGLALIVLLESLEWTAAELLKTNDAGLNDADFQIAVDSQDSIVTQTSPIVIQYNVVREIKLFFRLEILRWRSAMYDFFAILFSI